MHILERETVLQSDRWKSYYDDSFQQNILRGKVKTGFVICSTGCHSFRLDSVNIACPIPVV